MAFRAGLLRIGSELPLLAGLPPIRRSKHLRGQGLGNGLREVWLHPVPVWLLGPSLALAFTDS